MPTQTLFGVVDADGNIVSGSGGFTAQNVEAGLYSISFDTSFSETPSVLACQGGNYEHPSNHDGAVVGNLSSDACTIATGNNSSGKSAENRQFSFLAIGSV